MMLRPTPAWNASPTFLARSASADEWHARWRRRPSARTAVQQSASTTATQRTPRLARVEAALFVSDRPVPARRLAQHAALVDATDVVRAVEELNAAYDSDGSAFRVEHVATGYQLLTRPQFAPWLEKVHERRARLRLSSPAMETLAIVAYRQPLTRADVEAVRGVQSGEMLKLLMEREFVKIVGEHDSLGRPYLYGTTRQFLELFGLHDLSELPQAEGLAPPAPVEEPLDAEQEPPAEVAEAA
jgi:segregation and condensation protein B